MRRLYHLVSVFLWPEGAGGVIVAQFTGDQRNWVVLVTEHRDQRSNHISPFGFTGFLRNRQAELASADPRSYALCQVAYRVGVEPSYLSKIERGLEPPPGETTAIALAVAGKVSSELQTVEAWRRIVMTGLPSELGPG
jgi:HTH-type transcriptional regulator, competence development regulator